MTYQSNQDTLGQFTINDYDMQMAHVEALEAKLRREALIEAIKTSGGFLGHYAKTITLGIGNCMLELCEAAAEAGK